ncbi:TPA: hypothetical protein ACN7VP_003489, partial [Klebsiella pneumoniae]
LGCAPDEYDDLISGTCSHLPYQTWNIKLKKAIWNRGDAFLTNIGKQQFIHDAIDYSQFPVIACTARRKGWHLTLPADYREQNFRGGGRFDWASCRAVE